MKKIAIGLTAAAMAAIPAFALSPLNSGLAAGEVVSAFHPTHIAGPHKGTDACPPCTWGNRPMVQAWINPGETDANIAGIQKIVSEAAKAHTDKEFKGFVLMVTECDACVDHANKLAKNDKYPNIALARIASNNQALKDYKINLDKGVKNTVIVYKNRTVTKNFVNFVPDAKGIAALNAAINEVTK